MNAPPPATDQKTILIVDDDRGNLRMLNALLTDTYRVIAATSGERALELVCHPPLPDLILLDVMMPGMDGLEVCRRLKADPATAHIPIVFLTGRSSPEDEQVGLDAGASDYIAKPISPPIVAARVRTHLTIKQASDFLKDQNTWLEAEVAKRTREALAAAEARARLDMLEQELDISRRLQNSLLPRGEPDAPEVAISGTMIPAREVGGDFYDYFLLEGRQLAVVVADVSGKGVPAAFFMAMVRTMLRATARLLASPAECLRRVNQDLAEENEQMMFVTMFYGVLELDSGVLTYVNAGHNPPLVRAPAGDVVPLPVTAGTALAVLDDLSLVPGQLRLAKGDILFMYTDGVTEAHDPRDELFGMGRLAQALGAGGQPTGVREVNRQVVHAVKTFSDTAPQSDDITCLALQYRGAPQR